MTPLPLPLPTLEHTLQGFLRTIEPLLTQDELRETAAVVADFAAGEGQLAQEKLAEFARAEEAQGRSWLATPWLNAAYLDPPGPLPLTFSTAVKVAWDVPATPSVGLARASEILHRLIAVHLSYVTGDLAPELGFGGAALSDAQRIYLAGGIREPRVGRDEISYGSLDPRGREIGVSWLGSLFAVKVTDEHGVILPLAALEAALAHVISRGRRGDESPLAMSYVGSELLAEPLARLLTDPANQETYDRLTDMLLMANLLGDSRETAAALERVVYEPGQAWTYKPVTYQLSLVDEFVAVHMEHTIYDGASCLNTLAVAQALPAPASAHGAVALASWLAATPEPLEWRIPDAAADELGRLIADYRERITHYHLRVVEIQTPGAPAQRVSHDHCLQLAMLYAQLRCYGTLRSTYESVDMRQYQAGRTECMRPNTAQAVELALALIAGTATVAQFSASAEAHRSAVKAAKSGQGIDRHLFGLRHIAQEHGLSQALFESVGYEKLTTDILSTTSIGTYDVIQLVGFAPPIPHQIGSYYVAKPGSYEYLLSWRDDHCERFEEFVAALIEGTHAVWQLMLEATGVAADSAS